MSYEMDPPRLRASNNISIYNFFRIFSRLAKAVYPRDILDGNGVGKELRVVSAYPDDLLEYAGGTEVNPAGGFIDTITFQITRREPASLRDKPFNPAKELKPRFMDYTNTGESQAIEIRKQRFDNLIQLDCWTRSNKEADEMMEWLEEFLVQYASYFKDMGIVEMYYFRGGRFTWGTTEEEAIDRWRNPFKVRSVSWYVRTERLWTIDHNEIEEVRISLEVT